MKLFLLLAALALPATALAQTADTASYKKMTGTMDTTVFKFSALESPPMFKGGMEGFGNYLRSNLVYPKAAQEKGTSGKVLLSFVVEKDGSITDVIVERGIGDGCDEAAAKVIRNSPRWIPGKINGNAVRVKYNIPLSFGLNKPK